MKKQIVFILLVAFILSLSYALAYEGPYKGSYKNKPWPENPARTAEAYIQDKILYIVGEGAVDFTYASSTWGKYEIPYFYVDIEEGIDFIPCNAFIASKIRAVHIPKSVKTIQNKAFFGCFDLATVYYDGSESDWANIQIDSENDPLLNAKIYFNGEKSLADEDINPYEAVKSSSYSPTTYGEDYSKPDNPRIMEGGYSVTDFSSILRKGLVVDFGLTYYSGRIRYYRKTYTGYEQIDEQYERGVSIIEITDNSKDPSVKAWKVYNVDRDSGTIDMYSYEFYYGATILGESSILNVNQVLTNDTFVDFSACPNGEIVYLMPDNNGKNGISVKGTQIKVECPEDYTPSVLSWKIVEVDYAKGVIKVVPEKYDVHFNVNGKTVDENSLLPIQDTLSFPIEDKQTTINFYASEDATKATTSKQATNSIKLDIPSGFDKNIKAWKVKKVDTYNSVIDLYPNDDTSDNEYLYINYDEENPVVDLFWLTRESNVRIDSRVAINAASSSSGKGYLKCYTNSYDSEVLQSKTSSKLNMNFNERIKDVSTWVVESVDSQTGCIILKPEYLTNPKYNKLFKDPLPGEKRNPWLIGATNEKSIKAYIENSRLIIEGYGRMKDFSSNEAPWDDSDIVEVVIGEGISYIGSNAFIEKDTIKNVSVPSTVSEIGTYAFSECSGIEEITIPYSVKKIGNGAFSKCDNLSEVYIEKGLEIVGFHAFNEDYVEKVTFTGSEAEWNTIVIKEFNDSLITAEKEFLNKSQYTVTFVTNNAVLEIPSKEVFGGEKIESVELPNTNKCVFVGWYTDEEYKNKFSFSTPINSNITLYARWAQYIHEIYLPVPLLKPGESVPEKLHITTDLGDEGLYEHVFTAEWDKENITAFDPWYFSKKFVLGETYILEHIAIPTDGLDYIYADDVEIKSSHGIIEVNKMEERYILISMKFTIREDGFSDTDVIYKTKNMIGSGLNDSGIDLDKIDIDYSLFETLLFGNNGIIKDIKLNDEMYVTRAALVATLYRMEGAPEVNFENTFVDVEKGKWYETAINWAQENEIIVGYEDSLFRPDDIITKEQLATIICRYAIYKGEVRVINNAELEFMDMNLISEWAIQNVKWVCSNKIISQKSNEFNPKSYITKIDLVEILYRYYIRYCI